jgi:DNA transformation protein and related proteins
MATPADDFTHHCVELLGTLGSARAKRMFGGAGVYVDDLFVALIIGECLYLKADALSRDRFMAAGCQPFVYDGKGRAITVSYFTAPQDAMDSPHAMLPWARLALEAALRARAAKAASAARKVRAKSSTAPAKTRKPAARPRTAKAGKAAG